MNAHEYTLKTAYIPFNQGEVYIVVKLIFIDNYLKITILSRQSRIRHPAYKGFFLKAVLYEILYSNNPEIVRPCKGNQLRQSRHGAIFIHDFANDTGWL